jgi:hypothetical protein
MRVYLAAPYGSRAKIAAYASELTRIGFTVTSRWLREEHEITPGTEKAAVDLSDAQVAKHALDDLEDVKASDLLVLFTAKAVGREGGGGRHVETGYFIGHRGTRHVVVVGEPEHIFHRMKGVIIVPNWHEAVVELSSRLVEHERAQPQALCAG